MNSWKTSRDHHDTQKLYTQSNMKTNTSFELTQSIGINDFHLPHRYANSIMQTNRESHQHSLIYVKDVEINNNSSFSLQPTITPEQINQFFIMINMIKFYIPQQHEKSQLIRKKKYNIQRLQGALRQAQQRINLQKDYFQKRKEELQRRKLKVANFKKKKSRALTQQVEKFKYQIKDIIRALSTKNGNKFTQQQSSLFIEAKTQKKDPKKPTVRKKIYVPYQSHQYINPSNLFPIYSHVNPNYVQPHFANPSYHNSSQNIYQSNSQKASIKSSRAKEQIALSKLKQAMPIRIDDMQQADYQQSNLDYFNKSGSSKGVDKRNFIDNKKQVRNSNSSIKWGKDDNEDKQLVQFISSSIKHLKTQKSQQHQSIRQDSPQINMSNVQIFYLERTNQRRNNKNSDSSCNKSSDSKQDSHDKKRKSKNSGKSEKGKSIDQSNIKIQGIDMSISKNSASSKSDSSKHVPNRFIPSLNQHFHQIQEESQQQTSLKTTPIQNKLKNSIDNRNSSSKNLKKSSKQAQQRKSPKIESSTKMFNSPPNLYERHQFQEQDEILKSIKLDTESKISKNKNFDSQLFMKKQQDVDDILASINLLRQSKASRQKAMSVRSSINRLQQINQDKEEEKVSRSDIFSKIDKGQISEQLGSSLKISVTAKKNRNSYPESKEFMRKGFTQPAKRQLMSIPSAQIEQEQDQSHSSKNSPHIGESYR